MGNFKPAKFLPFQFVKDNIIIIEWESQVVIGKAVTLDGSPARLVLGACTKY